jgi:hypothetical protein
LKAFFQTFWEKTFFNVQIYDSPSRRNRFELSELEIGIEQVSGGVKRHILPMPSVSGRITFGGLETGIVYRFLTVGESGTPALREIVDPAREQPFEELPNRTRELQATAVA